MPPVTRPDPQRTYRRLARWFKRHARPMPWRGETDPYRVWVSEILLVQTTAVVAEKRYPRFLRRFPSLGTLARASRDSVLKEWEGLGYYNRARYLHQAAQQIVQEHGGRFPRDYDAIRALPGVGDYVAAAIVNFCFGGRLPPVDANVARTGARLFAVPGDVRSGRVRRRITEHLAGLMTVGSGSLWTDALIEVGAVLCRPRNPRCGDCPLRADCAAHALRRVEHFGLPGKKPAPREVQVACGVIRRRDGKILIAQRPEDGLLPGLWEFPGGKREGNERLAATCAREIAEELGITVAVGPRQMVIRHAYSHYHVRLSVFACRYRSGKPSAIGCTRFRWVRPQDLARYAFPAANRRIVDFLRGRA